MSEFEGKSYEELRKRIVKDELKKMVDHHFITQVQMDYMVKSHEKVYQKEVEPVQPKNEYVPKVSVKSHPKETINIKDWYQSLILILGVILVLTSGILFATTTWDQLFTTNFSKIAYLSLGSVLFYVASYLAEKKLRIEKTGFAFWVLGSLYIPILVLAVGYFKLFGHSLSLFGEQRYLLGFIGTIICIPIYFYSSYKYNNKFFINLSYFFVSINIAFLGLQLDESFDVLCLSLAIVNLGLFFTRDKIKSFTQTIHLYTELQTYLINILLFVSFFLGADDIKILFYVLMIITNLILAHKKANAILATIPYPLIYFIVHNVLLLYTDYMYLSKSYLLIEFISTGLVFILFYVYNQFKYTLYGKYGALFTVLITLMYFYVTSVIKGYYTLTSLFLIISSIYMYLVYRRENHYITKQISVIAMFILQLLSGLFIYTKIGDVINLNYTFNVHLAFIYLLLFIETLMFYKFNRFISHTYFIGINILSIMVFVVNELVNQGSYIPYLFILLVSIYYLIKPRQLAYVAHYIKSIKLSHKQLRVMNLYITLFTTTFLFRFFLSTLPLLRESLNFFTYGTILAFILYFILSKKWKLPLFIYVIFSSMISFLISIVYMNNKHEYFYLNSKQVSPLNVGEINTYFNEQVFHYSYILITLILLIILSYKEKIGHFIAVGLVFLLSGTYFLMDSYLLNQRQLNGPQLTSDVLSWGYILIGLILFGLGSLLYQQLFEKHKNLFYVKFDYFTVFAIISLFIAYTQTELLGIKFFIDFLIIGMVLYQIRRTDLKYIVYTVTIYYVLVPFYRLMFDVIHVKELYFQEVFSVPLIILTALIIRAFWKPYYKYAQYVEWLVIIIGLTPLFIDVFDNHIMDAILFGVITVSMIIYGFYSKIKSHFFLGGIFMLFLITFETDRLSKDTNSLLPWFTYLLVAGLLLIGIGSFYELQNKEDKKKFQPLKRLVSIFKKWK